MCYIHTEQGSGLIFHPFLVLCFLAFNGESFSLSQIPHCLISHHLALVSHQFYLMQCASLHCLPVAFKTIIFIQGGVSHK